MSKSDEAKAREQRLAEKLRENLKRRKAQLKARAQGGETADSEPSPARQHPKDESGS